MKSIAMMVIVLVLTSLSYSQEPWLPKHEQMRLRRMIPQGVPVSENLKFYKLPQVYQSRVILNGAPSLTIQHVTQNISPWASSGGMHHINRSEWRNVTGLDIPEGKKILIWRQSFNGYLLAQPVPKWYWRFPIGTVAYDVLIRKGSVEKVFEVRTQERTAQGWSDSTAYRPDVEIPDLMPMPKKWQFVNEFLGESGFTFNRVTDGKAEIHYVGAIEGNPKFRPMKEVLNDGGHLIPKDYKGTGMSCIACHNSEVVGMPTGYGESLRGNDNRFTWHPFAFNKQDNITGGFDQRWPIEFWKN